MIEKKCPSCGATVDSNMAVCKYCGEPLAVQQQPVQMQTENNYSGNAYAENAQSDNMFAYLKPYYQNQFKKIRDSNEIYKGKWNWCAFFFSWLWAFTKGLWGMALAAIGISVIISAIAPDLAYFSFLISIFFGIRGNYFYYNLTKNKSQFPKK